MTLDELIVRLTHIAHHADRLGQQAIGSDNLRALEQDLIPVMKELDYIQRELKREKEAQDERTKQDSVATSSD